MLLFFSIRNPKSQIEGLAIDDLVLMTRFSNLEKIVALNRQQG